MTPLARRLHATAAELASCDHRREIRGSSEFWCAECGSLLDPILNTAQRPRLALALGVLANMVTTTSETPTGRLPMLRPADVGDPDPEPD